MLTTDAQETIDRMVKLISNEIEYHEMSLETVTDVKKEVMEYLKLDILSLKMLKENIKSEKTI